MQVIKFGFVGGINTAIDFAVFSLLAWTGLPYVLAQCCSFLCGNVNSYFMNRKWTFSQKGSGNRSEKLKFLSVSLTSLLLTTGVLIGLHQYLQAPLLISKLLSAGGGMAVNYLGSRLWVFVKQADTVKATQ